MEIVETSTFTKQITANFTDEEYAAIQRTLIINPELGAKIPHSNGIRKLRWAYEGKGKRGGCRIIYYWIVDQDILFMLLMYPKNIQDDLTGDQLRTLRTTVERELK